MITLVTYDIADNKARGKLHGFLKEFGINTQKSVFECDIDDEAVSRIKSHCRETIDFSRDSVRIYRICSRCMKKVILSGKGLKVTQTDYMVV